MLKLNWDKAFASELSIGTDGSNELSATVSTTSVGIKVLGQGVSATSDDSKAKMSMTDGSLTGDYSLNEQSGSIDLLGYSRNFNSEGEIDGDEFSIGGTFLVLSYQARLRQT